MKQFDKEAVYDSEIAPLMRQIIEVCKANEIPVLASFLYKHGKDGNPEHLFFCTTLAGGELPDEFKEAVLIIRNGASTRPRMWALTIQQQ